jgi:phenylalanyl-tRNA synthetase beta chain
MKFSLSWLKCHLDTTASLTDICETLTRIGLEVEHVTDKGATLAPFVIAKTLTCEQHPNADKLRVLTVDMGNGVPLQVVCGAPNARAGMMSVFSPPGSYIPAKNITLAVGVIRGVESHGMLCSEFELELSNDHDGIIDLPSDAPLGMKYADYANLNDPVIEINLTPNRPDCTSIHGIARDLAAAGLGTLIETPFKPFTIEGACLTGITIETEPHFCPVFALRSISGVKNAASPSWMQRQLKAIGLRPISALVDVTNFVTFDQGRPLHVFDASKVKGNLVVRKALAGEEFAALDGKTYIMRGGEIVIADDNGIESLAGIMGGIHTGCDENTTEVLVESALWDPLTIARTGRLHGINTDARYRFERGIDPAWNNAGADFATGHIIEMCGGVASSLTIAGIQPSPAHTIDYPYTEVKRLTGMSVDEVKQAEILTKLGFKVAGNMITVPSWRPDVEVKACLVEEITRIVGLEHVIAKPLLRHTGIAKAILTPLQKRTFKAKKLLASRGMVEAVTWSFISRDEAIAFGGGAPELALANPIASDLSDMRPSLLPGLLKAALSNQNRGYSDLALFEVGQVFKSENEQFTAAAGLRRGAEASWQGTIVSDLYAVKADLYAALTALGVNVAAVQLVAGGADYLHPGRSGTIQFGPQNKAGVFGEIHPALADKLGLKGTAFVFEVLLDKLPEVKAKPTKIKPRLELSALMPLERDFAFLMDEKASAGDLIKIALGVDKKLVSNASIFDVYTGKGVPEGQKSIAIKLTLQPHDKTLTDDEIDAIATKFTFDALKKLNASLRA